MMFGSIPNPQPRGSQLLPGWQTQGSQLPPGGKPQGSQLPLGGQLQGSQLPPEGNLKDSTYLRDSTCLKVNPRLSTYLKVKPNFNTYLEVNHSFSMCLKVINLNVSTQLKVSNHLLVNHLYKNLEMYRLIISPTFNPVMVLHMHNLLWVHTPE